MKRLALAAAVAAVSLVAFLPAASTASPRANPLSASERECGLPQRYPLWIDFGGGSVPFWKMFAKPGLVSGASNFDYPPKIRALGGHTIYFDLNFHRRLGSPSDPVDTASVVAGANRLFYYAAASSGCERPWIGLNELFGASLPTPWSQTNELYRANVLTFIKILADHGAHVFLFVNSSPYPSDEAGDWWREVAKYTDFVREVYFSSPLLYQEGPVLGSRTLRKSFRQGVLEFTQLGIPVSKVGIFLGFQTEKGNGGREGLAKVPWFRTIKWQVLAARQVQRELKFATIWSWGWGEWGGGSDDPDKPAAACVYLWTRNPRLCNGPKAAGPRFVASRAEGQINLGNGVQCFVAGRPIAERPILRLNAMTHDPQLAFGAVFARSVAAHYVKVSSAEIRALERTVVATRFGGISSAYRSALAEAGASVGVARGILGDEVRRAKIESRLRVGGPSRASVAAYYDQYGDLSARPVVARPAPWWLGGRSRGLAIASIAPEQVFRARAGRWTTVRTPGGAFRVRPAGPAAALATFPLAAARAAIAGGLRQQAKADAYESWIATKEKALLKQTVCRRDALPPVGAADLTTYVPFLAL